MQTFSVKSGAKVRVSKLEKIQKRAMRCIDLNLHRGLEYNDLCNQYCIELLQKRRKMHHPSLMYHHSKEMENLMNCRLDIGLRSSNKVKFRIRRTKLTTFQRSPYHRGESLWDRLPAEVQRATTTVK